MGKRLIRGIITIVWAIIGYCLGSLIFILVASTYAEDAPTGIAISTVKLVVPIVTALIFAVIGYASEPKLLRSWKRLGSDIDNNIQKTPLSEIVGAALGFLLGLLIAFLISNLFSAIKILYLGMALSALAYIVFAFLGVVLGARIGKMRSSAVDSEDSRKSGLLSSLLGKGKSEKIHSMQAVPKILDTSVLIDGRITDIIKTGFIEGTIIIPEYVLTELRHLSDSGDPMKKIRGRRGLEVLKEVQLYSGIKIYNTYSDKDWEGAEEVDIKLLRLAKKLGGKVITNDFNLIQVADIQEIPVLNINDVVKALRPVIIPGEIMNLQIIKEGRENNQGVGYMDDGTMIVVEDGKHYIGKEIVVEVTTLLHTASGRMIFAKPKKSRS